MGVREERREEGRVVGSKIKKERQGQVMSGRGRKEEEGELEGKVESRWGMGK